jgi:hypothetical protein
MKILQHPTTGPGRWLWSFVLSGVLVLSSCSGSGDDKANTEGGISKSTLASGVANLEATIDEWAAAATGMYAKQVEAGKSLDHIPVVQELAPTTQRLIKAICGQLNAETSSEKRTDAQKAITFSVGEALARALAQKPNLLIAAGMTTWARYPPFMLKDPPPEADAPVSTSQTLSEHVKPEFIAQGGGIIIPKTGDPTYEDFRRWFYDPSLDNPLLERATVTSQEVRSSTDPCPK